MNLDDLYRRVIMDHYKTPRNKGEIEDQTVSVNLNNPTCGDRIVLQMVIEDDIVKNAKFTGEGCSISMASASMLTVAVKNKHIDEALQLANDFSEMMQGESKQFEYEEIDALSGVSQFPARIKCATLSWNALKKGVAQYREQ